MERARGRDRLAYRRSEYGDLDLMNLEADRFEKWRETPAAAAELLHSSAVTFLVNDHPEAVLGMSRKFPGVAMAWAFICRDQFVGNLRNTFSLIRLSKGLIEWYAQGQKVIRMETLVNADDEKALEFARVLGFADETGRLHKAGVQGEDLIQMVRFWEVA